MKELNKIKKQLEAVGLTALVFDENDFPYLQVYNPPKKKKYLFELYFDKKGNNIKHLVIGKPSNCTWIPINNLNFKAKKQKM